MKIHLEIRDEYPEPEIRICAAALTPEIEKILQLVERSPGNKPLNGYRQDTVTPLAPEKILRLYGENQKVFAQTMEGIYQLRERLYELEERLGSEAFLRISHSEIVNRRRICRLDVSLTGTIAVILEGGITTYVSRRYVPRIRKALEL
ncbi:MAG: LytTR family transcriptional regulator DNA-binding domain-containing protein [Clostridia bacterium]|nr:LytTR family transcriptional regulator DNA-binding domain-containing protein [Clostridia bacterium]MDD7484359.1 LytTR family DNA-binding domain-containing protein [Clostridia bacterium]MDY5558325.1 LytTR family DNA-binding domain-containing protein [Candidatus Heritagella sp.]